MGRFSFNLLKRLREEARAFTEEKRVGTDDYSRISPLSKFLHFGVLVGSSFMRNRCPVRAASLAYTTLLAMIPILAVAIGVASSMLKNEGEQSIQEVIDRLVARVAPTLNLVPRDALPEDGQGELPATDGAGTGPQGTQELARLIKGYINNINSGTLGVTGMLALVLVAISLLSTIEATFNDIWGVSRGRSWLTRVINYWAAVTLGPIILVLTMGPTVGKYLEFATDVFASMPVIGGLVFQFIPFLVPSVLFGMLYQLMPNTRVHWQAALVGGIVGGALWQLNNQCSAIYVSRVVTYSKMYGSLGMLPILLVSLYFSWIFVLLGAQVSYAFQNRAAYLHEKQAESVSQRGREFIALRLVTCIALAFQRGEPPPTVSGLSGALGVPSRLISQLLQSLITARLVVETAGTEAGYVPARPLPDLNCHDVLQALRSGHGHEPATTDGPSRRVVRSQFDRILDAEAGVAADVTFHALVEEAQVTTARSLADNRTPPSLTPPNPQPGASS